MPRVAARAPIRGCHRLCICIGCSRADPMDRMAKTRQRPESMAPVLLGLSLTEVSDLAQAHPLVDIFFRRRREHVFAPRGIPRDPPDDGGVLGSNVPDVGLARLAHATIVERDVRATMNTRSIH